MHDTAVDWDDEFTRKPLAGLDYLENNGTSSVPTVIEYARYVLAGRFELSATTDGRLETRAKMEEMVVRKKKSKEKDEEDERDEEDEDDEAEE